MERRDIEKFAFLYLCGAEDRALLLEEKPMTFEDFDRLTYLAGHFGFQEYSMDLWNRYGKMFQEQYEMLGEVGADADCTAILRAVMDPDQDMDELNKKTPVGAAKYSQEVAMHEKWIVDFCENAPTQESSELLKKLDQAFCEAK